MDRGTRKGQRRTRGATVRRAWLAAHLDARRRGAPIVEAQLLAEHEAARAGAAWTRQQRRRFLQAAIDDLKRRGARAPERTPAADLGKRTNTARRQSSRAIRGRDPDVQARKESIAARDRAAAVRRRA